MTNCKYCLQIEDACPCDKVDTFFNDNWHLLYVINNKRYTYAVISEKSESVKIVDAYAKRSGAV